MIRFIILLFLFSLNAISQEDLIVTKPDSDKSLIEKIIESKNKNNLKKFHLKIATASYSLLLDDFSASTQGFIRFNGGFHLNQKWSFEFDYDNFLDNSFTSGIISGPQLGVTYCFNICSPMILESAGDTIIETTKWSNSLSLLLSSRSLRLTSTTLNYGGVAFRYSRDLTYSKSFAWTFFGEYEALSNNDSSLTILMLGAGLKFFL